MGIAVFLGWWIVALCALAPLNWWSLWFDHRSPPGTTALMLVAMTVVVWGVAAGGGYALILLRRHLKTREAAKALREHIAMQELLAAPLVEVIPSRALLKPGEKAYAAVAGGLQEVKTVGRQAGSVGVSLRVAKGITMRTGSTRGKAIKGLVTVANGELVLTDRRLVFAGDHKSFSLNLDDLLSTAAYADGFSFGGPRTTYHVAIGDSNARFAFKLALEKVLRAR